MKRASGANTDAIREEIMTVIGVQHAAVHENNTASTNAAGLPPHSVEAVVYGGQDLAIAAAIWARKAAGIQTYGGTSVTIVDASGNNQIVKFSRPTTVSVWMRISNLQVAAGYAASDVQARIQAALIAYVSALGVGVSVYYTRLIEQINQVNGVEDYTIAISGDGAAYSTSNIPVSSRQTASTDGNKVVFV